MNRRKIIIVILILFTLITLFSTIFAFFNMSNDTIFSGIQINNIDMSGMSKSKANTQLSEIIQKKMDGSIKVTYNDEEFEISPSDINLSFEFSSAINSAYNYGKKGNILQNNFSILGALLHEKNFYGKISYDNDALDKALKNISSKLPNNLIQSDYYVENNNLIITAGKEGLIIDNEAFKTAFNNVLNDFSIIDASFSLPTKMVSPNKIDINKIHSEIYKQVSDAYYEKEPFKVFAEVVGVDFDIDSANSVILQNPDATEYTIQLNYTYPKTTLENLNIDIFPDLLATFSTRYDASNLDRSTNLQLAANKINGTVISPNQTFSYNKIVGERSISAGYKEAKVYSNGQVVDGIGGGICQISSTLYNAVVFANLEVTERFNHQFVSSYVSPGRDATVVYGAKDLKFINNRNYPIKIMTSVNNGIAKVDIYGIKEDIEYDISFDIETISTVPFEIKYKKDSSLGSDEQQISQMGSNGAIVNTYKILKKNGLVISKEFLSNDKYNALDRIIITKTGKPLS